MPLSDLWTRLRRSHLIQVLVLYLGASWGLLQVTESIADAIDLPAWVVPLVLILLLVGLLIVAGTAWVLSHPLQRERAATNEVPEPWEIDFRDFGRSVRAGRLPHLTWARAFTGGMAALTLTVGLAGGYVLFRGDGVGPHRTELEDTAARGIAVLPFSARGVGDDELWGDGLVDLLSTNLDGMGGLRAIDSRTVLARWRERRGDAAGDLSGVLAVAASAGAHFAVTGSVVGVGDHVRVAAHLYDVDSAEELGSGAAEGARDSVLTLVDGLSVDLLRQLLAREQIGDIPERTLASVTTASVPALRAYLRGEAANRRADFGVAAAAYEQALSADSTFALAAARLATAYGWMQQRGAADALRMMGLAARHTDRLPARDAALVGAYDGALHEGDPEALRTLEDLAVAYPDDPEAWYMLGEARYHLGPMMLITAASAANAFERAIRLDSTYAPAYIHAMEVRIGEGRDSARVARLLDAYAGVAAADTRLASLRLAFRAAFAADPAAVVARLDTLEPGQVAYAIGDLFRGGARNARALYAIADRLAGDPSLAAAGPDEVRRARATLAAETGRIERAERLAATADPATRAAVASIIAVEYGFSLPRDLEDAVLAPEPGVAPPVLLDAALVALTVGRERDAERLVERLRRYPGASADTTFDAFVPAALQAIEGFSAWKDGRLTEAAQRLEAVRLATIGFGPTEQVNAYARLWLGAIQAALRHHQRALVYLQSTRSGARALLLAGESLEILGRDDEARSAYADALHVWIDADVGFSPADRARRGLKRLSEDS